jgi:hypothetical protein
MRKMNCASIRILLLCALTAAFAGGCYFDWSWNTKVWETAEEDLKLSTGGLKALQVETHNGAITLNGAEGADSFDVHVTIKAGGEDEFDAADCLDAVELVNEVEDGVQKLGWKWAVKRKRTWQASVTFDITLPSDLSVEAVTHNGEVRLTGLDSKAVLRTHNGSVIVVDHKETLDAVTHNGRIEADVVGSQVKLVTHNGTVNIDVVTDDVMVETHNGRVLGRLDSKAACSGSLTTHNGSISISLGDGLSADVSGTTDNGRVIVNREMDIRVKKKRHFVGTVGDGGGKLDLETHNGDITVD